MPSLRGVVLTGLFAVCMVALLPACQRSKKVELSLQQWNDLINRELPRGSTRLQVEKFLDRHAVKHSYIAKSNFSDEANSVVAFVKSKDEHGVVKKSGIQLRFKFDADQHLVSTESKEVFTGP
jgi:hypothetical protein